MNNLTFIALLCLGLFVACQDMDSNLENADFVRSPKLADNSSGSAPKAEAGLKFKHGAGCSKPIGICFTKPIREPKPKPKPLFSVEETEEGWGGAILTLEGETMTIEPYRRAHNDEGWVPVTNDIWVNEEIAELLGKSSITILAGEYPINLEVENEWGAFSVNVEVE